MMSPRTYMHVAIIATLAGTCAQAISHVTETLQALNIPFEKRDVHSRQVYHVLPFSQKRRMHFDGRPSDASIQYLIIHYTHADLQSTMQTFTSRTSRHPVSAHYVIAQDGTIIHLVPDHKRAWHAGTSRWGTMRDINDVSIGIELINKGFTKDADGRTWYTFDDRQIAALGALAQSIVATYGIPDTQVLGHADIAPTRKHDPGILFPWQHLYTAYNVGAWIEDLPSGAISSSQNATRSFLADLRAYGYPVRSPMRMGRYNQAVVRAFKAHFSANQSPTQYTGQVRHVDIQWAQQLRKRYAADA